MELHTYIDHTLLKPDARYEQIRILCEEAREHRFASVCVNGCWVATCAELLHDSEVAVCTVIGFPLGAMSTEAKAFEAREAIAHGATEVDMVINVGKLKDGYYDQVVEDIRAVVNASNGNCVKVILETCLLTKAEIVKACECCMEANATFVKTSTGFSTGGASIDDVALMKRSVQGKCKVKASGGIRSLDDMMLMIEAGADRIGTSSGVALVKGNEAQGGY